MKGIEGYFRPEVWQRMRKGIFVALLANLAVVVAWVTLTAAGMIELRAPRIVGWVADQTDMLTAGVIWIALGAVAFRLMGFWQSKLFRN